MDRSLTGSTTEGGSSPDTVVAPSSSEDDRKNHPCTTSGEYVTVGPGSSSSLDTATAVNKEKKKGRFGALTSTLRKESLFKIRKKSRDGPRSCADVDSERGAASAKKDVARKRSQDYVEIDQRSPSPSSSLNKRKKKKSLSLVRKLSLNKFRLSSDQETRYTPEGDDSSRSQSQSSQGSPVYSREGSSKRVLRKEELRQHQNLLQRQGEKNLPSSNRIETEREEEKEKGKKKPEKLVKPVSTVTVVQCKSPSLVIKSTPKNTYEQQQQQQHLHRLQQDQPANNQQHQQQHDSRWLLGQQQQQQQQQQRCTSTLPYAISKWCDQPTTDLSNEILRKRLTIKADSESAATTPSLRSPPIELHRKLSLLEEKRAIFQRRLCDTTRDTDSGETVIAVTLDDESRKFRNDSQEKTTRKKARHISVRKFDTFSTFEGTFDEDTGLGYLAGIEENYTESYDRQDEDLSTGFHRGNTMTPTVATGEIERTAPGRSVSQDSLTSQGNASNVGTGEKREHLYKILVIGELGAGKTSIIKRYVHQFFSQHYRATIGVDFALKVLNWDPHTIIRLQLWDIAGQERFGNMTRVYYKEAVGAFIVFDVTRSATLDAVIKWKQDLDSKVQLPDGSPIPCVLLANKCDQQKEGLVNSTSKMDEYCKEKNFSGWFETSAKENINIEEAARFLVNRILQNEQIMRGNGSQEQTDGERFALNQLPTTSRKACSC